MKKQQFSYPIKQLHFVELFNQLLLKCPTIKQKLAKVLKGAILKTTNQMKKLKKIKEVFRDREFLAKLFLGAISLVLIYLVSKLVLISASAATTPRNIALVVLMLIVLNLSRKAFWLLAFPFVIFHALYLPVAKIFGKISYGYVASILATDMSETIEFLQMLQLKYLFYGLCMIVGVLLFRIITSKAKLKFARNKFVLISLVIVAMAPQAPLQHPKATFGAMKQTYQEMRNLKKLKKSSSWVVTKSEPKYDTYVLIIGESARKGYHGAYGYPIDNTTFMSSSNGVLVDGLIGGGRITIESLRLLLTHPDQQKHEPRYDLNFVSLANSAGFNTVWISNQGYLGYHDTPVSAIADHSKSRHFLKYGHWASKNTDDNELLPIFDKELEKPHKKPRLIMLHLYGSHSAVCQRLHGFKNRFLVEDSNYQEVSCYLASIEKTDQLLKEVKEKLDIYSKKQDKKYSMIYFSDHGSSHKYDLGSVKLSNIDTKQQYEIPLFKVSSDDTKRTLIKRYKSGLNFTNGIANWLGIEADQLDNNYSLFDPDVNDDDFGYKKKLDKLKDDPVIDIRPYIFDKKAATVMANEFRLDKTRFIAHAGGELDGHRYTNSLEALNQSYTRGYKMFELDILETSDKHFVAAHDWKGWAKMTKYKGSLPPTLKEFKQHKILGKYTPLDMDDINKWFTDHPDAIFVSDKVNKPKEFSSRFADPSRLQMELFSWEAVKEAVEIGLPNPMATLWLINKLPNTTDKVKYLQDLGVSHVVADRRMDVDLAKNMHKAGIKIYAYILGNEVRENETICYQGDYFHGIYADDFYFDKHIDCEKY